MAARLGVSQAAYGRWETGGNDIPVGALPPIAQICSIGIEWLLTGQAPPPATGTAHGPGTALIRLPRGDPRPLTEEDADLLEQALVVFRAEGPAEMYGKALRENTRAFYTAVQTTKQLSPGLAGKKAAESK